MDRLREGFAKARSIRRDLGWRVLFWRLLGAIGLRRVVLFRRGIEAVAAQRRPVHASVEFDRLPREKLDRFHELRPGSDRFELESRFDRGDECHVARVEGRIVSARWSSTREIRIDYLGYRQALASGQAYLYDAYTGPEYRKLGIAGGLTRHVLSLLHERGVREMLSAADPANPAGSGFNHSDGTPIGTLVAIGRRRRRVLTLGPLPFRARRHGERS